LKALNEESKKEILDDNFQKRKMGAMWRIKLYLGVE